MQVLGSHVERLAGTHPVYTPEADSAMSSITEALASINGLSSVGRHGSHSVLGMGESMEAAKQLVDSLVPELLAEPRAVQH